MPEIEVLTAAEAAEILRLHVITLRELARQGRVPARKVGREWRFVRSQLERWLEGQENGATRRVV